MNLNNLSKLLKNKKLLLLLGSTVFLVLLVVIFQSALPKKEKPQAAVTYLPLPTVITPTPTISVELQTAIDEAKQSAREYDDWHSYLRLTYPWFRKLPVATEKYYVYFDLNQEKFIGSLYPQKGDNPENLKAEALRILKEVKEIPIESYQFIWTEYKN